MGVDARVRAEHALHQMLLRHLEAEDRHGHFLPEGEGLRDAQRKAALAHPRPSGHNDQLGRLQPRRHLIQFRKARGKTRDEPFALIERVDRLDGTLDQLLDRHRIALDLLGGDLEDAGFRAIQQEVGSDDFLVAVGRDAGGGLDERAQDRFRFHDMAVVLHVGRGRHHAGQAGKVGGASKLLQPIAPLELVGQRHQIHGDVVPVETDHRAEQLAVGVFVEGALLEEFHRRDEGVFLQQHGAHDGSLGFEVLWREPFERGEFRYVHRLKTQDSRHTEHA